MAYDRPDPEALLARLKLDQSAERGAERAARGRLKIFFGATAGVGKTYAMLEAARDRKRDGVDVVVGYVETHKRRETEALLEGLEVLPRATVEYRGVKLPEFDIDGARERRPRLVLVDELAHTNAPGCRHLKRWQDVEELLASGVDVYSTVNVQHLESVNDLVARITGVRVRETVPDSVLERADELELVDIPPEELLKRLSEGKVYLEEQARRALDHFFSKPNLTALRQLALRTVAARVDSQMRVYRRAGGVETTWPVAERVLVGVGPAPSSRRLVRGAKRLADRLGAEWLAVFVQTPAYEHWPEKDQMRVWDTLRLAERLGAESVTLTGTDAVAEILSYARAQNVSKLVVGKPTHARWRDRLRGSLVDEVARGSGDMDLYVIAGEAEDAAPPEPSRVQRGFEWSGYFWAVMGIVASALAGGLLFRVVEHTNVAMLFLLVVVATAVRFGRGPSVLAAVLSVLVFDFFFVPPFRSFAVSDAGFLVTFAVMLVVALVVSSLATRLRAQARASRDAAARTGALYDMVRELVATRDAEQALAAGVRHIEQVFGCRVLVLLPGGKGTLAPWRAEALDPREVAVADWVFANGRTAGAGTDTLPAAARLYLPLQAPGGIAGVLGIRGERPEDWRRLADPERLHLLQAFTGQIAVALERAHLAEEALRTRELVAMAELKSEFVAAAAEKLVAPVDRLALALRRLGAEAPPSGDTARALDEASAEATHLQALARDLLDLSSLESGRAELRLEVARPESLIGEAMHAFEKDAGARGIALVADLSDDLPPVRADRVRIQAILANLLSNALRHSDAGGRVLLAADQVDGFVQLSVADTGAGVQLEDQARIFDRFAQVERGGEQGGTGLGLAIAREVLLAHGGAIWVDSGPGPGTVFNFTLPIAGNDA